MESGADALSADQWVVLQICCERCMELGIEYWRWWFPPSQEVFGRAESRGVTENASIRAVQQLLDHGHLLIRPMDERAFGFQSTPVPESCRISETGFETYARRTIPEYSQKLQRLRSIFPTRDNFQFLQVAQELDVSEMAVLHMLHRDNIL